METGRHFAGSAPRRRWPRRVALGATAGVAATVSVVLLSGSGGGTPPPRPVASESAAAGSSGPAPATSAPAPVATSTTTTAPPAPTLPDGSALPVLLVFDGPTISLSGALPSASAAARLVALASAYSKTPAHVVDHLVIDPGIPDSVGVRVIEMNAVRFAEGSAGIAPDYAPELGRVITLMKALPSVTALVIGHADQVGWAAPNLQLSQQRADAVVGYLVAQGISPDRLSAQGVGAEDPLTAQANQAGLALNRRTEFVFYGLFVGLGQ